MDDGVQPRTRPEDFYDERYHRRFQNAHGGDISGPEHARLFERFVAPSMTVVDFGCAGGWVLNSLRCARRIGVDVNPAAREHAERTFGIEAHRSTDDIQSTTADLVISNHALEHTLDPARHVQEVFRVLKPGGKAVFVTPCESFLSRYRADDPDQHLYTWSPANLGNLFRASGFIIRDARPFFYRWPPKASLMRRLAGPRLFRLGCHLWGHVYWRIVQVRVVAERP